METYIKIRDYIYAHGLKFNFVAEKAGINAKRFYRIINGNSNMSVEEYEAICVKGLSLEPGFFLNKYSHKTRIS